MLFKGVYKTQDYFRYFLHLFSVPSFIFSKKGRAYSCIPSKVSLNYSLALLKGWFHLWSFCSVKNASCLFTCIDLLKLKANKLFEISDADLPNLYRILLSFYGQWEKTLPSLGTSKHRVASLTPSKSYQVNACQIKAPRINSYYFLNQSFYFTIFCLVSI